MSTYRGWRGSWDGFTGGYASNSGEVYLDKDFALPRSVYEKLQALHNQNPYIPVISHYNPETEEFCDELDHAIETLVKERSL